VQSPVDGLYVATTAQIYPSLTNGESIVRHARHVADVLLDREETELAPSLVRPAVVAG
jgi:hypothetical protein